MKISRTAATVFLMLSQTPATEPAQRQPQLVHLAVAHLINRTQAPRSLVYGLAADAAMTPWDLGGR